MATPKKLPSGKWRTLVYSHTENGKRKYKSFTADTKKESARLASEYAAAPRDAQEGPSVTFAEACSALLSSKSNVLSPSTLRAYGSMLKAGTALDSKKVSEITQADIQAYINDYAATHSPKTVRNMHGLIVSVIHSVRPDMLISTTLPQKQRYDVIIPEDSDVKALISSAAGDLKKSILLAALGPLRMGEVTALRYEDIDYKKNTVHVHQDMVKKDGQWILKPVPKTLASDRIIVFPKEVIKALGKGEGFVVPLTQDQIYSRFRKLRDKVCKKKFRFHDLRHYSASIQHALGVPDVYIMQRGGWKTDNVMKTVYRHALISESQKNTKKVNEYFSRLI